MAILEQTKLAMRISNDAYDGEITRLINAAQADLGIVLDNVDATDALYAQAIITYVRMNFGTPDDFDRLKASYDEQKAQMMTATGYGFEVEQ